MPPFQRYIGVDYSGASEASTPIPGLRVYCADRQTGPAPTLDFLGKPRNWSRRRLARWLLDRLLEDIPTIVGLDHAFSYPLAAIKPSARESWGDFLAWFEERWPTRDRTVRECSTTNYRLLEKHKKELRLTDRWAPTAMPICRDWKGPNVFYSTHSGIPWLRWLRESAGNRIHFWPFDGFDVPAERSVVAEVYPRTFRRRYEDETSLRADKRDAWLICQWLKDRDEKELLKPYFKPPLDETEQGKARVEGWILGVA
jgi:hypothetical protein